MPRQFVASEAFREATPLLVGLTGPSSSGKTVSAILLAMGMQEIFGGEIFHLDTEARRALHYAPKRGEAPDPKNLKFKFNHVPFKAPFGPLDYLEAVQFCAKQGASVVIVDSTSHEHEGKGGVLEIHADEEERMRNNPAAKFAAWQRPKAERRQFINSLLQMPVSFIFCFRAKEKLKPMKVKGDDGRTKTEMVQLGWMPIAGEEFIYELTVSLILPPQSNGIPILDPESLTESQRMMFKIPGQFRDLFKPGKPLTPAIGRELASWATGGQVLATDHYEKQAAELTTHLAMTGKVEPLVGPDQSEPCASCKNNVPRCRACNLLLIFEKSGISRKGELYPGFWRCPNKCKDPKDGRRNTNHTATDWHAILEGENPKVPELVLEPGSEG